MHILPATVIAVVTWFVFVVFADDKAFAVLTAPVFVSAIALLMCALPEPAMGKLAAAAHRVGHHHILALGSIIGGVLLIAGRTILA